MHISDSYYVIGVRYRKMSLLSDFEAADAERTERKAVIKATANLPACRRRFKTKAHATKCLDALDVPEQIRRWLEVQEFWDLHLNVF